MLKSLTRAGDTSSAKPKRTFVQFQRISRRTACTFYYFSCSKNISVRLCAMHVHWCVAWSREPVLTQWPVNCSLWQRYGKHCIFIKYTFFRFTQTKHFSLYHYLGLRQIIFSLVHNKVSCWTVKHFNTGLRTLVCVRWSCSLATIDVSVVDVWSIRSKLSRKLWP